MQLRGEKSISIVTLDAFLKRVYRVIGRETVRRVWNRWLAEYDMHAADLSNVTAPLKSLPEELLEASVATARFTTEIADGIDRTAAARLADDAIEEIREVVEAVRS